MLCEVSSSLSLCPHLLVSPPLWKCVYNSPRKTSHTLPWNSRSATLTFLSLFLPSNSLQKLPGKFKNLFRKFESLTVSGIAFPQPPGSGSWLGGALGPFVSEPSVEC